MKIFPAVHYSMGGLWVDYERSSDGGLVVASPRNHQTSIPNLYAIGECDYHYHGANRLGANSLLSCIFTGLFVAPGIQNRLEQVTQTADQETKLHETAQQKHLDQHMAILNREGGKENPYLLHHELGDVMTKSATVVRRNDQLAEAYEKVTELHERMQHCSLSDTGNWTNQNVVFTKAVLDMFPLAKTIVKGALLRDECRGAHYKPEFAFQPLTATDPEARRREAEAWCDRFEENNRKWLKSTIAVYDGEHPQISYEPVDISLIPPRPRLYGLVGADVIEKVWAERQHARTKQPAAESTTG